MGIFLIPLTHADNHNALRSPVGTFGGWNFRVPAIGAADQLFGEQGSFHPLACTTDARAASGDSRRSLAERYPSREAYRARLSAAANAWSPTGFS